MRVLLFLSALLALSVNAQEIHRCGTVWQDRPCDSEATPQRRVLSPEEAGENSRKRTLLHDLTMKAIEAKREYDLRIDLGAGERACRGGALTECEAAVQKIEGELDRKVFAARQIQAQEQSLAEQRRLVKLQEEENRIQRERNEIELRRRNQQIVVIQNNRRRSRERPVIVQQETTVSNGETTITTRDPVVLRRPPRAEVGVRVEIGQ